MLVADYRQETYGYSADQLRMLRNQPADYPQHEFSVSILMFSSKHFDIFE